MYQAVDFAVLNFSILVVVFATLRVFQGISHFALYILTLEVWSINGFRATEKTRV